MIRAAVHGSSARVVEGIDHHTGKVPTAHAVVLDGYARVLSIELNIVLGKIVLKSVEKMKATCVLRTYTGSLGRHTSQPATIE